MCDAVAQGDHETGILRGKRKRAVDSTVFDDAVATMDTVSQLVAATRKVARVVDGAAGVIAGPCSLVNIQARQAIYRLGRPGGEAGAGQRPGEGR